MNFTSPSHHLAEISQTGISGKGSHASGCGRIARGRTSPSRLQAAQQHAVDGGTCGHHRLPALPCLLSRRLGRNLLRAVAVLPGPPAALAGNGARRDAAGRTRQLLPPASLAAGTCAVPAAPAAVEGGVIRLAPPDMARIVNAEALGHNSSCSRPFRCGCLPRSSWLRSRAASVGCGNMCLGGGADNLLCHAIRWDPHRRGVPVAPCSAMPFGGTLTQGGVYTCCTRPREVDLKRRREYIHMPTRASGRFGSARPSPEPGRPSGC